MMEQWAVAAQPVAGGIAGDSRVQRKIVADDNDAVRGHANVQFERSHTQIEALTKSLDGIFREQAARAAMADDLNLSCHGWP